MPDKTEARSNKPDLKLDDAQRTAIRDAVSGEDTHQRTPANYEPHVGVAITSAIKYHPLPQALIRDVPVLKQYAYVKLDKNIAIVDPMSMKVVDVIPRATPAAEGKPVKPVDWAATRGRALLGLPEENSGANAPPPQPPR
jgi:hypothetical protein